MSKHNEKPVPGYMLNVPTSPNGPYWVMSPTTHVCCALCGAKVRRRKFNQHLESEHPDYEGELIETPPLKPG